MREAGGAVGASEVRILGRASPSELIALLIALEEREGLEERDRRRLDREIGERAAREGSRDGWALLRRWLDEAPKPETKKRIARVASSMQLFRTLLVAIGLFLGWAAAAALLQVEVHAGRVNIVLCIGLLVILPFALLLAAILASAWLGRASADPAGFSGGWRGLAFVRFAMSILPEGVRRDVELLLGRMTVNERLYAEVRRAQLFAWSQWTGLAFALGALGSTIAFVVFTDLAFGWSTTLDVAAETLHSVTGVMAAPWAKLWPDAAPSLDLVETTRHFRVAANDPHVHFIDPIRFGGWWPFLVMSLLAYAFLPRAIATAVATRRLGAAVGRATSRTPGVERLLERLTSPLVETTAPEVEGEIGRPAEGVVATVEAREWLEGSKVGTPGQPMLIAWAESISDDAALSLFGGADLLVRDAGGRRSLDEDAERVAECASLSGRVALCVRAYEPPMLEVLDFLAELRSGIGPDRGLAVFLLDGDAESRDAWRHKLVTLGDPQLVCAPISTASRPERHDP